jgi:small subunit ribosomal protein S20
MAKLKTGRHTSALKAHRQSERKNSHNKGLKKNIRLAVKELSSKKDAKSFGKAASALDKAAKKGVLHWKTAARKKSRLAKSLNKSAK